MWLFCFGIIFPILLLYSQVRYSKSNVIFCNLIGRLGFLLSDQSIES